MVKGNKKNLDKDDLWMIEKRDLSESLLEKLESHWLKVANM